MIEKYSNKLHLTDFTGSIALGLFKYFLAGQWIISSNNAWKKRVFNIKFWLFNGINVYRRDTCKGCKSFNNFYGTIFYR